MKKLLTVSLHRQWRYYKTYDVMEYRYYFFLPFLLIEWNAFIIWDIKLSRFWIWRKIREMQGETYI